MPRICDYEGSKYRTDFWENRNREYEDRVERVAMKKLLPPNGKRLIEVGAGFGRLVDLYHGYEQIIIHDYALTQLEEARRFLGDDHRFVFVVADVYRMPFVDNLFDTLTMVRVMHHLADVPAALHELHRVVSPGGTAVVEHASKFHLKSLLRWLLRRQNWSPFEQAPHEFVELNFDFHPAWMRRQIAAAGFRLENTLTVSHYRIGWLKRLIPVAWLVAMDNVAQNTGNWWQLTPSLFLQLGAPKPDSAKIIGFFRCPACGSAELPRPEDIAEAEAILRCGGCGRGWLFSDGIFDFKTPVAV